jgi:hypothetical protein
MYEVNADVTAGRVKKPPIRDFGFKEDVRAIAIRRFVRMVKTEVRDYCAGQVHTLRAGIGDSQWKLDEKSGPSESCCQSDQNLFGPW